MKKINIKELAKLVNLSISTVSKALRDSHEISEQTKTTVLEAAEKFGYSPNPYASSLRKKKSKTIAVILPEVADNFFSLAINGIQSVAESKNYHVLIYLSHEKFEIEKNIISHCCSGRVDGVLISISDETTDADHILKLTNEKIPFVFFDREFEFADTAKVITNDFECGEQSARHLIERGCKHPVFLSVSPSLPICSKRAEGFKDAITEAGIDISKEDPVIYCSGNPEQTFSQIKELLSKKDHADGIVASVERLAMQIYLASLESGVRIPEDLKVIAFSTLETAPILNPSLTTITQPAFEIGKTAAELLFKMIEKNNHTLMNNTTVVLSSTLIERNSTAKRN
ncbi:MAG: LacI family DNA-binding transcriptional regulator [Lacibacter sp.]